MADTINIPRPRYSVKRYPEAKVKYPGEDTGGFGTIIAENEEVLVIKWPGGKHWVGRGMPPGYHSPCTDVLRKDQDGRFTLLISWDSRRKQAVH
ncbi:MAG: hypothetical protein O2960_06020 [Verrucomicrobia bacterium]|nr:hypothetical protein [Verrucomicrobiota bacterium]